eukprot:CAMPEP_0179250742 /NCGR_PEP_ID=MMETSP0797-20121207/21328_1 /TAXON_ID=47934 /ORGANISM="Dinophysis acuminata, Strain DAEP01" /LENGTH=35 /DNA_ID= /DNA_START= /DNA_END= /DNA_ORIENTATION=
MKIACASVGPMSSRGVLLSRQRNSGRAELGKQGVC